MLCNENITHSQGIPCEWVQIVLPLGIILAIFLGAAIPYMVWHIAVAIHGFVKRKIEGRRESKTPWHPHIMWSNDGDTGRIVTALNARNHKHHYEVIRANHDKYEFICRKDNCGDIVEIFRAYFWDGEKPTKQLYEEAIRAMRGNWQTEKFDV